MLLYMKYAKVSLKSISIPKLDTQPVAKSYGGIDCQTQIVFMLKSRIASTLPKYSSCLFTSNLPKLKKPYRKKYS